MPCVYKCINCGDIFEGNISEKKVILCPKCGSKIYIKIRTRVVKVDAI